MIKEAIEKIQAEIVADPKNRYVAVVGGFLRNYVREHPEHASLILAKDKTIAGSLNAMKEEAKKHKTNGVGILTDEEGFAVVLKYYGVNIPKPEPTAAAVPEFDVSLDDLL
ncbi:hypothetical protein [Paenibacillus sp. 32O-W]|uniref:hypothetical protein n=1 Tax=Paenibacillus sp. 32O-W TaxID=1695218 RepID=UPI0011A041CE|nr:hypothetical protein [Paenibacillus sp. 32O-W]